MHTWVAQAQVAQRWEQAEPAHSAHELPISFHCAVGREQTPVTSDEWLLLAQSPCFQFCVQDVSFVAWCQEPADRGSCRRYAGSWNSPIPYLRLSSRTRPNVIQSDVDNIVREHASSVAVVDDNETTAPEVALFAAADPENVFSIAETVAGETGVISLVTAHMRRIYKLLTFMATNEFGEGAVVQQSLLEANGDWHMDRTIAYFTRSHTTRIEKLRVIIVDKDLNEIRVLEANFPDARILICHFYAIKYLKEMRSKPEFGKIAADDASQIDSAVHKMVYAVSSEEYRAAHTNIRLENFFGKLKDSVNGSMSMAQCVKAILAYDRRKQNEYEYRVARIGQFVISGYDEEMAAVLRFTTHFVAQHIEQQYCCVG
ncbi:unnamed protein product [Phytophthora fragariaefolia]|uniref:Unnamed protein product n=1 Tax=Phytophthora fragariaefolia TaxID=1490495 RepID=A0A9W6XSP8_9STRA|nr:unnamed protein product [Phytophthora fragariaefolia]